MIGRPAGTRTAPGAVGAGEDGGRAVRGRVGPRRHREVEAGRVPRGDCGREQGSRLECICTEMLRPVAFAPADRPPRAVREHQAGGRADTRLSKLDAAFRELSPDFAEFIPYLAWMMSIPAGQPWRWRNWSPRSSDPDIRQPAEGADAGRSIRPRCSGSRTCNGPTIRRRSSAGASRRMGRSGADRRRHDADGVRASCAHLPWSDEELAAGSVVRIELDALSSEESRQLIAARSGSPPDESWRAIIESTGGNPLYIEEVVRSLVTGSDPRPKADCRSGRRSVSRRVCSRSSRKSWTDSETIGTSPRWPRYWAAICPSPDAGSHCQHPGPE